jgi:phenol 2-monooxygenase
MAALWMAKLGVKTRIVDKCDTKLFNGQADGISVRSLEIFDSLGFSNRVEHEAGHIFEMAMWVC